jgi:hypothetical protein
MPLIICSIRAELSTGFISKLHPPCCLQPRSSADCNWWRLRATVRRKMPVLQFKRCLPCALRHYTSDCELQHCGRGSQAQPLSLIFCIKSEFSRSRHVCYQAAATVVASRSAAAAMEGKGNMPTHTHGLLHLRIAVGGGAGQLRSMQICAWMGKKCMVYVEAYFTKQI